MYFCCVIRVPIAWKPVVLQFLLEAPLSAHTTQALITGRYPLQSGLSTSDYDLNHDLSQLISN